MYWYILVYVLITYSAFPNTSIKVLVCINLMSICDIRLLMCTKLMKSQMTDRNEITLQGSLGLLNLKFFVPNICTKQNQLTFSLLHFLSHNNYLLIIHYVPHTFLAKGSETLKKQNSCHSIIVGMT